MSARLPRSAVYIGTLCAIAGIVGGFVFAGTFSVTTISDNQNGYTASFGNTVWSSANVNLYVGTSSPTCSATTANPPTAAATSSLPVNLGTPATLTLYYGMASASGPCSASDFAEQWTISESFNAAAVDTNNFTVFASWTPAGGGPLTTVVSDQVAMTITGSTGTALVTIIIEVDFGSNLAPTSISAINLVVTGT
jgi:hypothetical protein